MHHYDTFTLSEHSRVFSINTSVMCRYHMSPCDLVVSILAFHGFQNCLFFSFFFRALLITEFNSGGGGGRGGWVWGGVFEGGGGGELYLINIPGQLFPRLVVPNDYLSDPPYNLTQQRWIVCEYLKKTPNRNFFYI